MKTFIVKTAEGETIEVEAERAETDPNSTRVTFYVGADPVGSFINLRGWHIKPAA